jgi:hypothetical protein
MGREDSFENRYMVLWTSLDLQSQQTENRRYIGQQAGDRGEWPASATTQQNYSEEISTMC